MNVFPVPDGDTGTNMTMTIMAAAKDVANLQNPTLTELGKAISSGSLRGARGNSGVIMSQIFRGFVKELKGLDIIDVTALGNGVQHAAETAYKAVMKTERGHDPYRCKGRSGQVDGSVSERRYGRYYQILR